jgi:biopolymer transport protein ExbD
VRWVLGALLVAALPAACSSSSSAARYCDVVKVAEVATDPLADQAIYNDAERLKTAFVARVRTYTDLAARAPSEISADANTVRDSLIKVNNALAAHGYQSVAANSDPTVQAALNDPAFTAATDKLRSYNAQHCVS